jgi:hypothetical protein
MAVLTKLVARLGGAALLSLLSAATAPPLAAEPVSARVELYGPLGLHVLTLRTSLDENGDDYTVVVDYQTAGLADLLANQKTHAVAHGKLGRATAYPLSFINDTVRDGIFRRSRVDYAPDGGVEGASTPAPRTAVPPALTRGTVDNVTAYLRLERQVALTGKCGLTVAVFDGRHRYDLVFADAGQQQLAPQAGQHFDGTAIACRMTRYNRVVEPAEQNEGATQGTFWYAHLLPQSDTVIPIRMHLETQIGTVDGYLTEVRGGGVNLHLID